MGMTETEDTYRVTFRLKDGAMTNGLVNIKTEITIPAVNMADAGFQAGYILETLTNNSRVFEFESVEIIPTPDDNNAVSINEKDFHDYLD